jgi:hypothetical protein
MLFFEYQEYVETVVTTNREDSPMVFVTDAVEGRKLNLIFLVKNFCNVGNDIGISFFLFFISILIAYEYTEYVDAAKRQHLENEIVYYMANTFVIGFEALKKACFTYSRNSQKNSERQIMIDVVLCCVSLGFAILLGFF